MIKSISGINLRGEKTQRNGWSCQKYVDSIDKIAKANALDIFWEEWHCSKGSTEFLSGYKTEKKR